MRDTKGMEAEVRRVFDYKKMPLSKLLCPMCREELNLHIDAYTCYSAVSGPYVRGRVALTCSNDEGNGCHYQHATNFQADESKAIRGFEQLTAQMIRKLPDFGPWETFHITEGENRRRKRK